MKTFGQILIALILQITQGLIAVVVLGQIALADTKQEIKLGPSCITSECHSDINQGEFLHGPLNFDQCEPCHVTIGNRHEFQKPPEGNALCLTCHEAEAPKKVVHSPFLLDCGMCHNPHGLDNRYFLIGGPGPQGCQRCHTDVREGLAFLHGPVAQGECLACHTAHQSDYKMLLNKPPVDLCLDCHVDFQEEMEGAVTTHQPVQKDCGTCHGAHGGATEFLLAAQGRNLCQQCHADFLKGIDQFKFPHKAMTKAKACENCHDPHASKQEQLLTSNSAVLCLKCHNELIEINGRKIANIAAQIESAKYLHGPLRQNNCIACHQGHGSNFPRILRKAFPTNFYARYTDHVYDLCFDCHDKKLVLAKRSTNTDFRNGNLNLHYLHVHREKGRSCRSCHHEHASNQPKHIRDQVPFGRWIMSIKYQRTETGGTCITGCHLPYKYDRESPVQNK